MRVALMMLLGALAPACRQTDPGPTSSSVPPAGRPHSLEVRPFEAGGEVVATASDRSLLLVRAGAKLVTWSANGERRGELTPLAANAEDGRYAIASTGLVAESVDRVLRVSRSTGETAWQVEVPDTLWGDLVFSPDGRRLALMMAGQVSLVDAATGKDDVVIGAEPGHPDRLTGQLTLPRRAWFSGDGARVAIACGRDAESPANHALFVADTRTGVISETLRAPFAEAVEDAVVLPSAILALDDDGTLYRFEQGLLRGTLSLGERGRLAASPDGMAIAVAPANQRALAWRHGRLAASARAKDDQGGWPAFVTPPDERGVLVLGSNGSLHAIVLPAVTARDVPWHPLDVADGRAWAAVWAIASGDVRPETLAALSAGTDPVFAVARALAEQGNRLVVPRDRGAAAYALAAALVGAGYLPAARVTYDAALAVAPPRALPPADSARAMKTGLQLALGFSSIDDEVSRQHVIEALYVSWSDDARVVETYADAFRDSHRDRALGAVERYLRAHPGERALVQLRDELRKP
ncbi:MAG: hypothetical protein IPQ07_41595 [Myxococcales bacterium]|nr:hypothetical protein [Myxococcales bacterium]